jgi:hypothetical protein
MRCPVRVPCTTRKKLQFLVLEKNQRKLNVARVNPYTAGHKVEGTCHEHPPCVYIFSPDMIFLTHFVYFCRISTENINPDHNKKMTLKQGIIRKQL